MSGTFWKRLSLVAGLFTLAAIFGLHIFASNLELKDLDIWLHIGVGRYIVEHGFQIPTVDVLSCSIAGNPWVNHEWLFQVIVYWLYTNWGADGIITLQTVLVTVTLLILVFLGYNKDKQLATLFCLLLVSLVYQGRFTTRPDLFSLLFFALYIFILSLFIDRRWSVWVLFVIQVLWTNIHGFFFFGPLFVMIGLFAEWLKRHAPLPYEWNHMGRLTDDEYRRLKIILAAVVLACVVNPLTVKGAWYPIGVFLQISGESKIFFDKIVELKKPIAWGNILDLGQYQYYKLLILLSFISFVYNRRKIDIGTLFFWLVFLFFSLSAIRNLVFFAFAAYLVFVTNAMNITLRDMIPFRVTDKKFVHLTSTIVKIFLTMWIINYIQAISLNGYYDFDKYERKSEFGGVTLRNYPYKAVDFLVENRVQGNFFNDFNSGAYLIGRCFPNIKVFIDGRTEVYGPQFFKYYQKVWEDEDVEEFERMLKRFKITGVLLNSVHSPIPKKIINFLYKSKEWVPVYFDFDAVIFLKKIDKNKDIIDRFKIDLAKWPAKELDLLKLGFANVTPYQNINRAHTLDSLDLYEPALGEALAALKAAPDYSEPYNLIGGLYGKMKEYRKAFEYLRIAAMYAPRDRKARFNFALAYYDLGEYVYASEQYKKIINTWPDNPKGYYLLARTYIKDKQYEEGTNSLKKAFSLDPQAVEDLVKIGDVFLEEKQYDKAREVFSMGVKAGKKQDLVHLKLGSVYQAEGDDKSAREEFEKGLAVNPQNEDIKKKLKELPAS